MFFGNYFEYSAINLQQAIVSGNLDSEITAYVMLIFYRSSIELIRD